MKVFKRSGSLFYSYKFQYKGKEYYRSTGTANRRDAEDIAATARRSIIRQLAGLEEPEAQQPRDEPTNVPTLQQFQPTFNAWVATAKEEQQGTVKFYKESYRSSSTMVRGPIVGSTKSTSPRSKPSKSGP
jgi:hypothetical protein